MSSATLAAGVAIAFLAAICQSVTGFGFALVMAPLIAIAWAAKPGVATTVVLSTLINVMLLFEVRGHASLGRAAGLFAGYLCGMPLGLLVLDRVDGDTLQVLVAASVIIATLLLYLQPQVDPEDDNLPIRMGAGAISGATGAATSIGGPPVVLYLLGRERDVRAFRATLLAFFLPSSMVTTTALAVSGYITDNVLLMSAAAAPAVVAGALAGAKLRQRLHPDRFRAVVVGTLVATSLAVIGFTVSGAA